MTSSGIRASRSIRARVDLRLAEVAQLGEELLAALRVLVGRQRVRVDQVEPEAAEEQLLGEAGLAPVLFAGRLGDLAGFTLGDGHLAHLVAVWEEGSPCVTVTTDGCYSLVCTRFIRCVPDAAHAVSRMRRGANGAVARPRPGGPAVMPLGVGLVLPAVRGRPRPAESPNGQGTTRKWVVRRRSSS